MGVMDGRRFRYVVTEDGFTVWAHPVAAYEGGSIYLGDVTRERRSTDSKIAGTRLIRHGKGATEWSAQVPQADVTKSRPGYARHLQGSGLGYREAWRLEDWRGQRWDRRQDAAEALAHWYDHPERRET